MLNPFLFNFFDKATPAATGIEFATIAVLSKKPTSLSIKCIEPPLPPLHPVDFPIISEISLNKLFPLPK